MVEHLHGFVEAGGTPILTYLSGVVNESNLCFRKGFPGGGLRALCGIWAEVLTTFGNDFYAGSPAFTRNRVGEGAVYYLAAKMDDSFWISFSEALGSFGATCMETGEVLEQKLTQTAWQTRILQRPLP